MIEPRAVTADTLTDALIDARSVELGLIDALTDDELLGPRGHFVEPPIWEIGHVGWFQEYWILRRLDGADSILPGSDSVYDAFHVSYKERWDHAFPSRKETIAYLSDVLRRSVARIQSRPPTVEETYFYTLAALHEDMHAESLMMILQTHGYQRPVLCQFDSAWAPAVDLAFRPHDVHVPGGPFLLGADSHEPFVFDNEKWAHAVDVKPFRISATPVTNAEFQAFVDDDGYRSRECWSRRGWNWRRREGAEHPVFWVREGSGHWQVRQFDGIVPIEPWHPVVHVNWYEAEAFCRWAGRRLPTEAEWEMAATFDFAAGSKRRFPWGEEPPVDSPRLAQNRPLTAHASLDYRAGGTIDVRALPEGDSPSGCRQMIGNVWEWVADTFSPYPGFVCDPYAEYSQPYFGEKKVLRGGSWMTRSRLIRPTYRNFFKHQRRNIPAGFRTAAR